MNESVERPNRDEAADEELSDSLAGHSKLPVHGDDTSSAPVGTPAQEAVDADEDSPVLEEIEDSPVRTKNS